MGQNYPKCRFSKAHDCRRLAALARRMLLSFRLASLTSSPTLSTPYPAPGVRQAGWQNSRALANIFISNFNIWQKEVSPGYQETWPAFILISHYQGWDQQPHVHHWSHSAATAAQETFKTPCKECELHQDPLAHCAPNKRQWTSSHCEPRHQGTSIPAVTQVRGSP